MEPEQKHPLATAQSQAAFTIAALFWAVGLAMIDPRTGVGILLCVIGIAATGWLFWSSIKLIPSTAPRTWPWLGLMLLIVQIGIPTYMLLAKPGEPTPAVSVSKAEEIAAAVSKAIENPKQTEKNATILLDCEIFFDLIHVSPYSEVLFMQMTDPFEGGGGPIGFAHAKADKDGLFTIDPKRPKVFDYRCELKNFEDYPIFSVFMNFGITANKAIKTDGGIKAGETVSSREWPIGLNYVSPKSTITFYVFATNQKLYVSAQLPQYAQYMRGGNDTKFVAKLMPPGLTAMVFAPMGYSPTKN